MTSRETDPWVRWYEAYLTHRGAVRAAKRSALERRRAGNLLAGLLLVYMLMGGLVAGVAVGLVMAN